MKRLLLLGCAAVLATAAVATAAWADETVKWMHIEQNPGQVAVWRDAVQSFDAQHPGVTVDLQFLENEAFKAKLTTILQSRDKPSLFYSWGGGVLRAQVEAGVLEDLTDKLKGFTDSLAPTAVDAFKVDGRLYGVPYAISDVGVLVNKALLAKAGVDPDRIKTWDDFLGAVKALKAAGVTPLAAGGGDKWPLSLIWSYLSLREGGRAAFDAAMAGQDGGFAGPSFVKASEDFQQLCALQPFQPGFLGDKSQTAIGLFADGRAAMTVAISTAYAQQHALAADKKGLPDEQVGWIDFPAVPGGKGLPTDTLGGINGWLVSKGAPAATVPFVESFVSLPVQSKLAAGGFLIPVVKGGDAAVANPVLRHVAEQLSHSTYHQNFYDQALGPNVGRTVNDVTAQLAGGTMTPRDGAAAIEAAWKQGN
jgi:raffinose/stachyose/melibiose transport system substrate-binding protein